MKCVIHKESGKVSRVKNEQAVELVGTGQYSYTSKTKWKRARNNDGFIPEETVEKTDIQ